MKPISAQWQRNMTRKILTRLENASSSPMVKTATEDFLLASSAVPGLYLFFKEYTASHLHTSTLFRARMINLALIIACGAIGVLFMISMVCELAQEQALSK